MDVCCVVLGCECPTLKSRQVRLLDICLLEQSHDHSNVGSVCGTVIPLS